MTKRAAPPIQPAAPVTHVQESADRDVAPMRVFVEAEGTVSVPAGLVQALGLKTGDPVVLTIEDGEIRVMPIAAAVKRAQAIVRRYVPEGVSLVDELIAERREEARREEEGD